MSACRHEKGFPFWPATGKLPGKLYTSAERPDQTFAFRESGFRFVNQIALGKTVGIGRAGRSGHWPLRDGKNAEEGYDRRR
jgi:hypothetical protein